MSCKEGTRTIAQQIRSLLLQLDQASYARPLDIFNGSSIGQHFRHIIDFYDCLVRGVKSGKIDYASRDRHTNIETDPTVALKKFDDLLTQLDQVDELDRLEVKADFSPNAQATRPIVASSVGRELMFACDHAIHHLALIKIGLQTTFPELALDPELGVAPSTVRYQAEKM